MTARMVRHTAGSDLTLRNDRGARSTAVRVWAAHDGGDHGCGGGWGALFAGVASDFSFTFMPPIPAGKFAVSISSDTVLSLGLTKGEEWADIVDPEVH